LGHNCAKVNVQTCYGIHSLESLPKCVFEKYWIGYMVDSSYGLRVNQPQCNGLIQNSTNQDSLKKIQTLSTSLRA